jgi:hypothetical protein
MITLKKYLISTLPFLLLQERHLPPKSWDLVIQHVLFEIVVCHSFTFLLQVDPPVSACAL